MNILIADDEQEICRFLRLYLEKDQYTVFEAHDGLDAWNIIQTQNISLALLDIMMPGIDGFMLIKRIRESYNFPIIMLTAKSESESMVLGLGLGADDYITKPFNAIEVCARVEANLRRFYELGNATVFNAPLFKIIHRDLELDLDQCRLHRLLPDGTYACEIELTSMEYKIIKLFFEHPGKVFTKQEIYESVWKDIYVTDDGNIMSYISKIRDKLGDGDYIKTIRGLGYRLNT